ncbi:hypothetical protein GEMRC1_007312 [Eukaryota sp. GEM-RC1]
MSLPLPVSASTWSSKMGQQVLLTAKIEKVTPHMGREALQVLIPGNEQKFIMVPSGQTSKLQDLIGRLADFTGVIQDDSSLTSIQDVVPFAKETDMDLVKIHSDFIESYISVISDPVQVSETV